MKWNRSKVMLSPCFYDRFLLAGAGIYTPLLITLLTNPLWKLPKLLLFRLEHASGHNEPTPTLTAIYLKSSIRTYNTYNIFFGIFLLTVKIVLHNCDISIQWSSTGWFEIGCLTPEIINKSFVLLTATITWFTVLIMCLSKFQFFTLQLTVMKTKLLRWYLSVFIKPVLLRNQFGEKSTGVPGKWIIPCKPPFRAGFFRFLYK